MTAGRPVPPLIESTAGSRLIRLRDQILTLAAWAVTALLVHNSLVLIWDFLRPPVFHVLPGDLPAWQVVFSIVLRYQLPLEILGLWALVWALMFSSRRAMRRRAPPALPVQRAELAAGAGIPEATLAAMEKVRLIEVTVGREGRIAAVRAWEPLRVEA